MVPHFQNRLMPSLILSPGHQCRPYCQNLLHFLLVGIGEWEQRRLEFEGVRMLVHMLHQILVLMLVLVLLLFTALKCRRILVYMLALRGGYNSVRF